MERSWAVLGASWAVLEPSFLGRRGGLLELTRAELTRAYEELTRACYVHCAYGAVEFWSFAPGNNVHRSYLALSIINPAVRSVRQCYSYVVHVVRARAREAAPGGLAREPKKKQLGITGGNGWEATLEEISLSTIAPR